MQFVGNSSLRWGGAGGETLSFDSKGKGWQTSEGTFPEGSQWRKVPFPRAPYAWAWYGASFEPVCEESAACIAATKSVLPGLCKCSGDKVGGMSLTEVVDRVHIPAGLKPGNYVLGWRWGEWVCCVRVHRGCLCCCGLCDMLDVPVADGVCSLAPRSADCEESTQVWVSCSDVTIKAAA